MATYTQPTGFLAATFPSGTIANTTNLTAGTIANLTNLPAIPANWLTAAGINASALNGKGDWPIGKTGYSISGTITTLDGLATHGDSAWPTATGFATPTNITAGIITTVSGNVTGSVGSVVGLTPGNLDATVSSRLATSGYTAPDNADITSIKTTIGTAGAGLTALGDTRLAHLDADISSRSTFAGGAVASVTGNVGGNLVGSVGSVVGLTVANLDATISSRLASASYTAPDNTDIAAIKAKTDNLPTTPAAVGSAMTLISAYDAAKTAAQPGDNMGTVTAVLTPIDVAGLDPTFLDVAVSSRLAILPQTPGRRG